MPGAAAQSFSAPPTGLNCSLNPPFTLLGAQRNPLGPKYIGLWRRQFRADCPFSAPSAGK